MKTDTSEQIAERLPDEYLPMEGRRVISQTILAIAIKSPEAAEYWRKKERQQCIDAAKAVYEDPIQNEDNFTDAKAKIIKALEAQSDESHENKII